MGSVALEEAGVASGTNSTVRGLGGVFGVAVLATVFARHGVYTSPATFVDGFTEALWVAVGFSGLGVVAALLTAARPRQAHDLSAPGSRSRGSRHEPGTSTRPVRWRLCRRGRPAPRRGRARALPGGLPPPGLPAARHRLPGQARHAGLVGPEVEALYADGAAWLAGEELAR